MAVLWTLLGIAVAVAWIVAFVDIVKRRHALSGGGLAAWLIIVLVFPVVGTVLYFAVGRTATA